MESTPPGQISYFDRSLKAIVRRVPGAFFRLAGLDIDPSLIQPQDVAINLPEFRADQVFRVGEAVDPDSWAMHLEYQLEPDPRVLRGWFLKNAALTAQLETDVILLAVYLRNGARKRFPSEYVASAAGFRNEFRFHSIRLWEHAYRIRSGELPELAPLLLLCEDEPELDTVRRERELLRNAGVAAEVKTELLSLALTVAGRYFPSDLLQTIFREDMEMLKEAGFIEEWMAEREAQGEAKEARAALLTVLRARLGEVPDSLVARIMALDVDTCHRLLTRAARVESWSDIEIP